MFARLFGCKKSKRLPSDIAYKEAKKLARDRNPAVRSELAERDDVRPEILYFMAEDKMPEVRRRVAANSATPGTPITFWLPMPTTRCGAIWR